MVIDNPLKIQSMVKPTIEVVEEEKTVDDVSPVQEDSG